MNNFSSRIVFGIYYKVDPKHGPQRKTAGVRNLPKIDRNAAVAGKAGNKRQQAKAGKAFGIGGKVDFESNGTVNHLSL